MWCRPRTVRGPPTPTLVVVVVVNGPKRRGDPHQESVTSVEVGRKGWRIFCFHATTDDGRLRSSPEVEREGGDRSDPMQRKDGRIYKDTKMVLYPSIPCKVQDKTRGPHATRLPDSIDPPEHTAPRKGTSQIRSLSSALSWTIRYSRDAMLKHCMLKHTPGCSKVKTHAR